jgi:hypothetical protein
MRIMRMVKQIIRMVKRELKNKVIATLALGLRPRQRAYKVASQD